jgi:hypothetical protein
VRLTELKAASAKIETFAGAASFGPIVKLMVVPVDVAEMLSTGAALAIPATASARSATPATSPFVIPGPTLRCSSVLGN